MKKQPLNIFATTLSISCLLVGCSQGVTSINKTCAKLSSIASPGDITASTINLKYTSTQGLGGYIVVYHRSVVSTDKTVAPELQSNYCAVKVQLSQKNTEQILLWTAASCIDVERLSEIKLFVYNDSVIGKNGFGTYQLSRLVSNIKPTYTYNTKATDGTNSCKALTQKNLKTEAQQLCASLDDLNMYVFDLPPSKKRTKSIQALIDKLKNEQLSNEAKNDTLMWQNAFSTPAVAKEAWNKFIAADKNYLLNNLFIGGNFSFSNDNNKILDILTIPAQTSYLYWPRAFNNSQNTDNINLVVSDSNFLLSKTIENGDVIYQAKDSGTIAMLKLTSGAIIPIGVISTINGTPTLGSITTSTLTFQTMGTGGVATRPLVIPDENEENTLPSQEGIDAKLFESTSGGLAARAIVPPSIPEEENNIPSTAAPNTNTTQNSSGSGTVVLDTKIAPKAMDASPQSITISQDGC